MAETEATADDVVRVEPINGPGDWRQYDPLPLTPILEASLEAFQLNGYHGASIRDIARRVGVSMPSLYYHYGNIEGILIALLDVGMDDLQSHLDIATAEAGDDPFRRFCNLVMVASLHETRRRHLAKLHPESRFLGEEAHAKYVARRNEVNAEAVRLLEVCRDDGLFAFDDSHFVARAMFAMMQGAPQWFRDSGPDTPDDVAEKYLRLVIAMVAAPGREAELQDRVPVRGGSGN